MTSKPVQPPYRCFIETDKHTYFPGDTVSCKVDLSFDRRLTCEEVTANFTGEARVQWIEKQVSDLCRQPTYTQYRKIFEQTRSIWNVNSTDKKRGTTLKDILRISSPNSIRPSNFMFDEQRPEFRGFQPGKYILPVKFTIPKDIIYPSLEVEEELIYIRYKIEILLDGRITKAFHRILHVIVPRDLNDELDTLGEPASSENVFVNKKGKLTAMLTLPKTGYTQGEPLNARVTVLNMTSESVKFASVSIVKKFMAISEKPVNFKRREDETNGSILPFHKIQRGERREWQAQLHVPALTPTLCIDGFITVDYEAKLSVGFERGRRNATVLHMSIPITIGSVAIDSTEDQGMRNHEKPGMILKNRSVSEPPYASPEALPSAPPLYHEQPLHVEDAPPRYLEVIGQNRDCSFDERQRAPTVPSNYHRIYPNIF